MYTGPPRLLSSSLASVRAPVGTDALTLDCSGSGDPDPVIHWLRGDTVLPIAGEQVRHTTHTPHTHTHTRAPS